MIKITTTYEKLVLAATSGALARFHGIRKTITAGHKNRKMPAAIREELAHYDEARKALVEKHGGFLATPDAKTYTFPEGQAEGFADDLKVLLAQEVDLPGEAVKLADLLDGGLLETDYSALEPFLTE